MRAAARLLEGRHDSAAFQASGGSSQTTEREVLTLRIAECGVRSDRGLRIDDCGLLIAGAGPGRQSALRSPHSAILLFDIRGSGFLRHMVRIIVGSLVEVGRGRQPVDWIGRVLASRIARRRGRPRRAWDSFWSASTTAARLRLCPKSLYTRGLLRRNCNVA